MPISWIFITSNNTEYNNIMKTVTDKAESWSKSIITWALLGIAASQFMDLRDTVKEMHKLVIKHENQLDNHKEEINRMRDWHEASKTQISQSR